MDADTDTALPTPTDGPGHAHGRPSLATRLLLRLGRKLRTGTLRVVLPNGRAHRFGGHEPGPDAVVVMRRDRLARRFLIGGNLGFCEAYLDGDWWSPDVEALFCFFLLNEEHLRRHMRGAGWFRLAQRLVHMTRRNSRDGARRNIAAHYDLGNAFYEKWLDTSMTYSSAWFPAGEDDLTAAQRAKYEVLAQRLTLAPGQRMLEIGCGWGGFAEFAAAEVGARVTAITLSPAQYDYAQARIQRAGLGERVEIRLQDYRDVDGRYDRIASIEMLEAVGQRYWPRYFATLRDRLVSGGHAALQAITIADGHFDAYRRSADYIQRYIFPGGMLPSPGVLMQQIRDAGLRLHGMSGFGHHYVRTLRAWNRRFQSAWPEIERMGFDGRFKRMWEQYLHYCAAGFRVGRIDVVHLAMSRD